MKAKRSLLVLAVGVLPILLASPAWATHPTITAAAICDSSGNAVIQYTSTAWDTTGNPLAVNPQIDILFNDIKVGSGAYGPPTYSFSGSAPAPQGAGTGSTVIVTALAVGSWGGIYAGGQSDSVTVTIPSEGCTQPGLGRMTGGGKQVTVDIARITKGLTIHCDLLLSNNLEVNWNGNSFHMLEHITTIACTDDPDIIQFPPAAPFDTLIGEGIGRYNGADGYSIRFTFVDAGEPGTLDKAALKIWETANPSNVVLDLPLQPLKGGNLQAHYDQPHK